MKIIRFYISAFVAMALMAVMSCGTSIDKLLEGTWILDKSTIPNLDSVAESRSAQYTKGLQSALEMINQQLDTCTQEASRRMLMDRKAGIEKDIAEGTPEKIKSLFEEQQKQLAGKLTMIFGSDGVLTLFIGEDHGDEFTTGTWTLQGDTIRTLFDNNPSEDIIIRNVSSGSLELESMAIDATGVNLILEFSRI